MFRSGKGVQLITPSSHYTTGPQHHSDTEVKLEVIDSSVSDLAVSTSIAESLLATLRVHFSQFEICVPYCISCTIRCTSPPLSLSLIKLHITELLCILILTVQDYEIHVEKG
jgi:hypothetical protein